MTSKTKDQIADELWEGLDPTDSNATDEAFDRAVTRIQRLEESFSVCADNYSEKLQLLRATMQAADPTLRDGGEGVFPFREIPERVGQIISDLKNQMLGMTALVTMMREDRKAFRMFLKAAHNMEKRMQEQDDA